MDRGAWRATAHRVSEQDETEVTQHACRHVGTCTYKWASLILLVVKNTPTNAGDTCLVPELGGSLGGGHGNPLQYSCLENLIDRGAWQATVQVAKGWTQLKQLSMHECRHMQPPLHASQDISGIMPKQLTPTSTIQTSANRTLMELISECGPFVCRLRLTLEDLFWSK